MNQEFWIQRVKAYGHTGWSDQATYLYDQKMRLSLIRNVIIKYFNKRIPYALDYGCGSGDFSNLLSKYSEHVVGVDIANEILEVAKKKYSNIEFNNIDHYKDNNYELIISITVLQHLLNDDELNKILSQLYTVLSDNGIMVIIDSYSNKEKSSTYLKQREYEKFLQVLQLNHFTILESHNLYHPQDIPTNLYFMYRKNFFIKILNRLKLYFLLDIISSFISQFDNPLVLDNSSTKLTIIKKRTCI